MHRIPIAIQQRNARQLAATRAQNAAFAEINQNTPEWQAALANYNSTGVADPKFAPAINRMRGYFKEGQANPGNLTQQLFTDAQNQWAIDNQPGGFEKAVNNYIMPALLAYVGGGIAGSAMDGAAGTTAGTGAATGGAADYAGGYTAAGTGGTGAAAGGVGAALPAGGMTPTGTSGGLADAGMVGAGGTAAGAGGSAGGTAAGGGAAGGGATTFGIPNSIVNPLIQTGLGALANNNNQNAINNASNQSTTGTNTALGYGAPWLEAGTKALAEQQKLMGLNGDPTASLNALKSSPNYQFALDQGTKGLNASVAAKGGMGSGKAATEAAKWNQDFASNQYNNRLNQLSTLSGTGQVQSNTAGNLTMGNVGNQSNLGMASANSSNSMLNTVGNALSGYLNPTPSNVNTNNNQPAANSSSVVQPFVPASQPANSSSNQNLSPQTSTVPNGTQGHYDPISGKWVY